MDYAAKHQEQDGHKWAIRNAKLRFSRKLLYAAGLAFCFACHLDPPNGRRDAQPDLFSFLEDPEPDPASAAPFIAAGEAFAGTAPLEYLAAFVDAFVSEADKRQAISHRLFGTYNSWLELLGDDEKRKQIESFTQIALAERPHGLGRHYQSHGMGGAFAGILIRIGTSFATISRFSPKLTLSNAK